MYLSGHDGSVDYDRSTPFMIYFEGLARILMDTYVFYLEIITINHEVYV